MQFLCYLLVFILWKSQNALQFAIDNETIIVTLLLLLILYQFVDTSGNTRIQQVTYVRLY